MDKKKGIDFVASVDTTGSMYQVLANIKRDLPRFVKDLHAIDKDIRIGIIVHGDYCDADNPYTLRACDLTRDTEKLCKFIQESESTNGGDSDECYELMLKTARTDFSWEAGRIKILMPIGDCNPHKVGYRYGDHINNIDWKNEVGLLRDAGVMIYAVHALARYRKEAASFYRTMAKETGGECLELDQFHEVIDLIQAAYYKQFGEEELNRFVTIIRDKGGMSRTMAENLSKLSNKPYKVTAAKSIRESELIAVPGGRFQVIDVNEPTSIKGFIESNGITFKKGRAFYELTKAETVQQYKDIILQDKTTGDLYTGPQVRVYLGLQPQTERGGASEKAYADKRREYIVYIQSTSVNRKLVGGTKLLYELSDI